MAMLAPARATAAADHGVVRILAHAHSVVREFVGDGMEIRDARAFSCAVARARWSELGGDDSEGELVGGCLSQRSRFAQLWPPFNHRLSLRGIGTGPGRDTAEAHE